MFRLPHRIAAFSLASVLFCASQLALEAQSRVDAIRYWSFGDVTRVAIQTQGDYKITSDSAEKPFRVFFDLNGLRAPATAHHGTQTIQVGDRLVKQIRVAQVSPGKTRIVFDLEGPAEVISSQLVNPDRLMIEVRPKGTSLPALSIAHSVTSSQRIDLSSNPSTVPSGDNISPAPLLEPATSTVRTPNPINFPPPLPVVSPVATRTMVPSTSPPPSKAIGVAAPASRDSTGDRSFVRVFGLKLGKVVIDAGHGGHDTGTIGPDGLMEKDLVLDVALRLGKLITQQLGAAVVYTRADDTFIPLEDRTRIANDEKADLFISIHANSSPEPSATGVETYFFNLSSDRSALDLATRENATSASSISDLNDLLHKAVLQTKLEESREFAQRVQASLWATSIKMNSRSRDRGVRQAPFVVLIGATHAVNPCGDRLRVESARREIVATH